MLKVMIIEYTMSVWHIIAVAYVEKSLFFLIVIKYSIRFVLSVVLEKKIRYKISVGFNFRCKIY